MLDGNTERDAKEARELGRSRWPSLPGGIWAMGFASLFMDASSEMIHSLLPAYLTSTLGASIVALGLIEGIAEAAASVTKVFSGVLSDYFGKRKFFMLLGYGMSALTKPLFPLARSIEWVLTARFADRVGKGIRGAPRDGLIADLTKPGMRGAAYGLRQSLDSVGAVIGPVMAVVLMVLLNNRVRTVMFYAVLPAMLAVALLSIFVREPDKTAAKGPDAVLLSIRDARRLPLRYWLVVAIGAVFTLARFSEAFLILRAAGTGLSITYAPLTMVVMNLFYSGTAYPAGIAADRRQKRRLLLIGLLVLVAADVLLSLARIPAVVFAGAALWGVHMALTQGLLSKLIADNVPCNLVGTGFGIFNMTNGGALFMASLIAGVLWIRFGASTTFLCGALFASLAAIGIAFGGRRSFNTELPSA